MQLSFSVAKKSPKKSKSNTKKIQVKQTKNHTQKNPQKKTNPTQPTLFDLKDSISIFGMDSSLQIPNKLSNIITGIAGRTRDQEMPQLRIYKPITNCPALKSLETENIKPENRNQELRYNSRR